MSHISGNVLRFLSALHCGYGGITDIQDGFFLY